MSKSDFLIKNGFRVLKIFETRNGEFIYELLNNKSDVFYVTSTKDTKENNTIKIKSSKKRNIPEKKFINMICKTVVIGDNIMSLCDSDGNVIKHHQLESSVKTVVHCPHFEFETVQNNPDMIHREVTRIHEALRASMLKDLIEFRKIMNDEMKILAKAIANADTIISNLPKDYANLKALISSDQKMVEIVAKNKKCRDHFLEHIMKLKHDVNYKKFALLSDDFVEECLDTVVK